MFQFYMPSKLIFGAGALNKLGSQPLPGKKALIVISSGKSTRANGYLDRTIEQLKQGGAEAVVFDKILSNPVVEHVMEGAAMAKAEGCDFVVGLGGGSSIDSSKSIAVMATNPGDYWDYVGGTTGKKQPIVADPLPVIAIPTTAGTGTEADPFTVITKLATKEKIGFSNPKSFPVFSIIDPELMASVPPHLTAYQGFDALFHSTEGYLNKNANPLADLFAIESIKNIGAWLAKAVADGANMEAREHVAFASTLSGINESTSGCTSEHALEHALSAYAPTLQHGAGLIIVSVAYYKTLIAKGARPERFVDMAKWLGKTDATVPEDFITALEALQAACGVSDLKLSEFGFKAGEFDDVAKVARETMGHLFMVDPVEVTHEDVVAIYEASFK
ncbi:MAG: iron-containing alcohol dehydrogenase [Clostridiales Family XIII bacterium]|jgi:alcohol dehydrogenase|nr:iron-containing alcohol dehydrogenase [Clostridiales Family XIII bacterium]